MAWLGTIVTFARERRLLGLQRGCRRHGLFTLGVQLEELVSALDVGRLR